uniref:Ribonuclease H-like domain-containing protein n=1 Tax=Tanacetum cinerariifolium TaxID=118510 RepID=A0A699KHT3_TANCI|nr:ribonuclease H-like domain-containing protein [Tanacetum cinerariifolium]
MGETCNRRIDTIIAMGTCPISYIIKKLMEDMLPLEVTPNEGKSLAKVQSKLVNWIWKRLTDENHVLLRVPKKNNMYSVDLKNIIPKGGLTCLFAKATSDESRLWHRRLGNLNFKTMNKLVKGNLIRGLPSKFFGNEQTCVARQKGKQHKASFVKPHNKTPYALFHGRTPMLSFVRPFGYPVTILNTIDHLGKFDGKADEGLFVGYSLHSKAFRVFNSRTKIMEETLHIRKKVNKVQRKENECKDPEEKDIVYNTNKVNDVRSTINAARNKVNAVGRKLSIELPNDPNMPDLEDISILKTQMKMFLVQRLT